MSSQSLAAVVAGGPDQAFVLELLKRRVDRARARLPHAVAAVRELLDQLVAVARLLAKQDQRRGADVAAASAATAAASAAERAAEAWETGAAKAWTEAPSETGATEAGTAETGAERSAPTATSAATASTPPTGSSPSCGPVQA